MITNEALRVLTNNLAFSRNVNRQYDDKFANSGAKIGNSIDIRKPARYTVATGAALAVQDHTETAETLTLDTQAHVDVSFTTQELTLDIDSFSDRFLKPAMAAIANKIDYDGLGLYADIANSVGTPGTTPATAAVALAAHQKLTELGAPLDERSLVVNPAANAGLVDGLKGLFNSTQTISDQFRKGMMGMNTLGFGEIMTDANVRVHANGAQDGAYLVNNAAPADAEDTASTSSLIVDTGTGAISVGDVFTIADVYAVNPQNRASTGSLQQFVMVEAATSGSNTWTISPAIRASGAFQTVDSLPANNAAITFVGTLSTQYPQNLAFHKDAFVLGTADLLLPKGVDMASRQTLDGISMRIVRQYDINNDQLPCRIDVLYGWKTVYPELAVRVWG
jgi:hypothetical protein